MVSSQNIVSSESEQDIREAILCALPNDISVEIKDMDTVSMVNVLINHHHQLIETVNRLFSSIADSVQDGISVLNPFQRSGGWPPVELSEDECALLPLEQHPPTEDD